MPRKKKDLAVVVRRTESAMGELVGHADELAFLLRAKERDRLAHACLVVGPDGVGKTTFARRLAAEILGVDVPETHPDFLFVERGRDAKTGALNKFLEIDQIADVVSRLSLRSFMGGWKVCVIAGIEHCNDASVNALLKTLEEPAPRTLMLLTATSLERVVPTIVSRCQPVHLRRVAVPELSTALMKRDVDQARADLFARLADGRPGIAFALAADPAIFESLCALRDIALDLPAMRVADRFAAIDKLLPAKTPFNEAGERARAFLDIAGEVLRDALLVRSGLVAKTVHIDEGDRVRRLAKSDPIPALAALEISRTLIDANVQPRAALERFVLAF